MTDSISPLLRKFIAIALLVVALWILGNGLTTVVVARIGLGQKLAELEDQFISLRARRYDIGSLEKQLAEFTGSPALHHAVLIAPTDRIAFAALQRSVRTTIQSASGALLSISEIKDRTAKPSVGLQVRARVRESHLKQLIERFEQGEPRLTIGDLMINSKATAPAGEAELELTATVQALWLQPNGTSP